MLQFSKTACNLKQYNGYLTQPIVRNWRGAECMITEALKPQVHDYTIKLVKFTTADRNNTIRPHNNQYTLFGKLNAVYEQYSGTNIFY